MLTRQEMIEALSNSKNELCAERCKAVLNGEMTPEEVIEKLQPW